MKSEELQERTQCVGVLFQYLFVTEHERNTEEGAGGRKE